ncbi:MAG TPA: chemotaxis protein CheW [Candidatus Nitrosotenuis sp.]|nr:chemotaxis protein CheW [Candidatus Nitrosotenuis sp.]
MSTQIASTDTFQVVSFVILNQSNKKEDYAIPIEQVREIRSVEKITRVPRSESFVRGIMNLRGLIIPVIDVKEKLGLGTRTESPTSKQRILVVSISGSLTGLLVDEVDQVMRIQTKDIEQAPQGTVDSHYIKGIAKLEQRLVVLLDAESLLLGKKESIESTSVEKKRAEIMPEQKQTQIPEQQEKPQSEITQVESANQTIDDIPAELAAVFSEDQQGIPPTQIIRENSG